jgi:hypothetical protein
MRCCGRPPKKGGCSPAGEAAQIAMEHNLGVAVVCRVLGAPRSTIYARRRVGGQPGRPGPVPPISDEELVQRIRQVLADSPFAGEGYRKVRARLRREHGVHVSVSGCYGCCAARGCWRPSGRVAVAGRAPMTARSSPRLRTGVGARMPRWPGPGSTGGCGCSRAWITTRRGLGARGQDRRPVRCPPAGL